MPNANLLIWICIFGNDINDWGTKKEWPNFNKHQSPTLNFCSIYFIIIIVNCCMLRDKMVSCYIKKLIFFWILCKCHFESFKLTISSVPISFKSNNQKDCIKSCSWFQTFCTIDVSSYENTCSLGEDDEK